LGGNRNFSSKAKKIITNNNKSEVCRGKTELGGKREPKDSPWPRGGILFVD